MNQRSLPLLPRGFVFFSALALFVIALETFLITPMKTANPAYDTCDCRRYIALAQGGPEQYASEAPFCWRILIPAVVRMIPMVPERAFHLLTIASLIAAAILFLLYCRARDLSTNEIAAALCFFLFSRWITGRLLFEYALVDAEALVFILLIFWLSEIQAPRAITYGSLVIGVLCKELVIVAGVYVALREWSRARPMSERITMGILPIILPLAVLLTLHLTIKPGNNYSLFTELRHRMTSTDPILLGYFHYTARQWGTFVYDATFGTWGAIALLVIMLGRKFFRRLVSRIESATVVCIIFIQPLVAWNLERLLIFAFPIIVVTCIEGLRDISWRKGPRPSILLWSWVALQSLMFLHFLLFARGIVTPSLRNILFGTITLRLF